MYRINKRTEIILEITRRYAVPALQCIAGKTLAPENKVSPQTGPTLTIARMFSSFFFIIITCI